MTEVSQSLFHQVNDSYTFMGEEKLKSIKPSQSLFHQVNDSYIFPVMLAGRSQPRHNPFFIRSTIPTNMERSKRIQKLTESQSLFHQVNDSYRRD